MTAGFCVPTRHSRHTNTNSSTDADTQGQGQDQDQEQRYVQEQHEDTTNAATDSTSNTNTNSDESGVETLLDLYVQYSAINQSSISVADSFAESNRENAINATEFAGEEGIDSLKQCVSGTLTRHLGCCDFPLVRVLCQLPNTMETTFDFFF
jgi:hypothetical protein